MFDIVMISGKQGSGKTTLANELQERAIENGYQATARFKFADTLYNLHDVVLDEMAKQTGNPRVTKDGVLLQLLGTEWGRKVHGNNIWVKVLIKRIDRVFQQYRSTRIYSYLIIIDDCRFRNEFDALPYACRVRLECDPAARKERAESWRDNQAHPSEVDLDDYASRNKFDQLFHTDEISVKTCAVMVFKELRYAGRRGSCGLGT